MPFSRRTLVTSALSAAVLGLTGCGLSSLSTSSGTVTPLAVLAGTVHGGQSPVVGARIFVFEAATTGYGKLSLSDVTPALGMLDSTYNAYYVTTDSGGAFELTGEYTCTAGAQVYLLATQGNPGLAPGETNPALAEMSALGSCPATGVLSPALNITISEASTVAAVYALAGYMTGPNAVSRPATALAQTGLNNAFATVGNLATLNGYAMGTTPGSNSGTASFNVVGTAPTAKINLLANMLASCINSDGTGTPCATLFANATSDGTSAGTVPTDTVTAMLNIAHHPAANVATLYSLVAANGPFQPATATQPNDFTLAVGYTVSAGGAAAQPVLQAISIDAAGDVIIPFSNQSVNFTGVLSNLGTPLSNDFSKTSSSPAVQYAIDQNGYAWTATGNLSTSVGALTRYTILSGAKVSFVESAMLPTHLAIDSQGHILVADPGARKVQSYNSDGTVSSTPLTGTAYPHIAIDVRNNLLSLGAVVNLVYVNGNSFSGGGLNWPGNLTADGAGGMWVANTNGSNTLSRFLIAGSGSTATLTAVSPSGGYGGGGLKTSTNSTYAPVIVDGASSAWYANYDTGTVSSFTTGGVAITPSTGYALADHPEGLAIDGSGNVWVTVNNGFGTSPVLYEMIGAAVPLATPILPGQLGVQP